MAVVALSLFKEHEVDEECAREEERLVFHNHVLRIPANFQVVCLCHKTLRVAPRPYIDKRSNSHFLCVVDDELVTRADAVGAAPGEGVDGGRGKGRRSGGRGNEARSALDLYIYTEQIQTQTNRNANTRTHTDHEI